jgi:alpha-glucoside transport system substrate-binding protein
MARTIGRYEIREELGRGGMAAVYLAFDSRLDRQVALKLMDQQLSADPAFTVRFEREAKTVAGLTHNAIVSLYDFGEADGWLYLVMPFMQGGTLKDLIASKPLPAKQAYNVIRRIGSALDKAHSQNIIHRDLKPANILLDEEQEPYLSDFGIVKVAKGDTEYLTDTGQTLGTYAYMSPEQIMGQSIDGRSDLYALGIILHEMLTGKHPFEEATTTGAMAVAHAQQPVPAVTLDNQTLAAALNDVIGRAMAKDPNDRYATGREMALAFYEALTAKPETMAAGAVTSAAAGPEAETPESPPPPAVPEGREAACQQPSPVKQPAVASADQPAPVPAAKQQRKTPVWILVVIGVVAVACIGIVATAALSAIGGSTEENRNEVSKEATRLAGETVSNLAGQTVTILTVASDEQVALFEKSLQQIEERTGVDVVVESSSDFETLAITRAESGDPPGIYAFPQPGLMAELARRGFLVDLNQFLADDYLRQQYKQTWLDMGTVDGVLVGVWHEASVKSLVWYSKKSFDELGLEAPQTWDELLGITEKLAVNGFTPWCIGIESGVATGWPGSDWIEDIMLRTVKPEVYDQWVTGQLPFSSPEVLQAFELMGQIWLEPVFVAGGSEAIAKTNFLDAVQPLFDNPPGCLMHRQASFISFVFPEGVEYGVGVDYFYLPPIDEAISGRPVLIAGSVFSLAKDTPAGRVVMEYMTTGDSVRAEVESGGVLAPHNDVPLAWYPDEVQRGYAQILEDADTVRFDGSDLMPAQVGAGSFWTGIVDYVNGADLDTVLKTIEASWP